MLSDRRERDIKLVGSNLGEARIKAWICRDFAVLTLVAASTEPWTLVERTLSSQVESASPDLVGVLCRGWI